ncbi:MAG: GNAT family N-acetyltransferase [Streptosporangiaceae bacterium]|jgi:predicted acetyltransferase
MPELILPTARVHVSFLAAMAELEAEGRGGPSDSSMVGQEMRVYGRGWAQEAKFSRYVRELLDDAREDSPRASGYVPATTLWWVSGEEYLGRIAIRHRLTPYLRDYGGHIGYDVRPSARRRGNATAMLAAALPAARRLGVDPALVTCDQDNVGSRKVIEANGGVFDDQRGVKLRYWLPAS